MLIGFPVESTSSARCNLEKKKKKERKKKMMVKKKSVLFHCGLSCVSVSKVSPCEITYVTTSNFAANNKQLNKLFAQAVCLHLLIQPRPRTTH